MQSQIILTCILVIHFSAIFIIFKLCEKRNGNIQLWGLLSFFFGALTLPLFFMLTTKKELDFKFVKNSKKHYIVRYSLYGSLVGVSVAFLNISYLIKHDTSTFIFYIPLIFFPSFLVSSPWSLASIFTDNLTYKIIIMTIGATLNGMLIGAAYGALKDDN